jgi:lipopolysaccharide assembly outer membrane protein LptD (OstA)
MIAAAATQPTQEYIPAPPSQPLPLPLPGVSTRPGLPSPGGEPAPVVRLPPTTQPAVPDAARIFAAKGTLTFNADKYIYDQSHPEENVVLLIDNVRFMYQSPDRKRVVELKADNAVVFLEPGAGGRPAGNSVSAGAVTGIYLEDNVVITDGQYTARAPRVFYDLASNKAVMLDAVLFAYDARMNVPMYLRAEQLRQESRNSWSASQALLTTSEFAEPHFAVASSRLTLEHGERADGNPVNHITASNNVFEWEGVPVGYWPYLAGDAEKTALQNVTVGYDSRQGPVAQTHWDMFRLTG